LDGSVYF